MSQGEARPFFFANLLLTVGGLAAHRIGGDILFEAGGDIRKAEGGAFKMAKDFAGGFYNTGAWYKTRNAYFKYRAGLCEECLSNGLYRQGEIVHHKIPLTPENIDNPMITLSWDNLELLCRECHLKIHGKKSRRRYKIDSFGNIFCE